MSTDQGLVFAVLAATLGLLVWNRWRYDIVALGALLALVLAGVIPAAEAFSGLGHPAVITVAAVLVISRGLLNAGVVDVLARRLMRLGDHPGLHVLLLTAVVALCSGFMNNVGALALFLPVAVWMSRQSGYSPSLTLMPLAFGSLLGGMLTMIGTPPNIIIASYRAEVAGEAFGLFAFLPVGLAVTLAGVAFIGLLGWRLTPRRQQEESPDQLFKVSAYLTEVRIPEDCSLAGQTTYDLMAAVKDDADVMVVGLVRGEQRQQMPSIYKVLQAEDILLVEADSDSLKTLLDVTGLELAGRRSETDDEASGHREDFGELTLVEAVISPGSLLVGTSASALSLRQRHSVNILAVARRGARLKERLGRIRFLAGDILLLQAREDALPGALESLGCLPLASRELEIGRPRKILQASALFVGALAAIALGLVDAATGLVVAALLMVLSGLVPAGKVYDSIDMPVIVLLAALLPVGQALETTGGAALIAGQLLAVAEQVPAALTLALLMMVVMLLSNIINNAAAAILAAPVAIDLAAGMQVAADPLLMAVAIAASSAFLTPVGHQSNTLVMAPGGYRFGDYWRMGLPLSLLVVLVSVPVLLLVWPL
ncbi:MAG: SLC13 family permease [Haliea sp.]|nr:SLC13 family permease [Haliea sp.]|tara:strand:- start:74511 stop:76307 length:1797 start_codon:yes stop_codon:yes gene_type:complete